MAVDTRTPVAAGTAGFVDVTRGLPEASDAPAVTDVISTGYTLSSNRSRYITRLYFFNDIDDGDSWLSGITGIKFVMYAGDDADVDLGNATLTSASGAITFQAATTAQQAWVLLFIDPAESGLSGVRGL